MNCGELLQALNDYVDRQQSSLCQALEEHLLDCNPCRMVIDNIRQTITVCRAAEIGPMPAARHEQFREILRKRWVARSVSESGSELISDRNEGELR